MCVWFLCNYWSGQGCYTSSRVFPITYLYCTTWYIRMARLTFYISTQYPCASHLHCRICPPYIVFKTRFRIPHYTDVHYFLRLNSTSLEVVLSWGYLCVFKSLKLFLQNRNIVIVVKALMLTGRSLQCLIFWYQWISTSEVSITHNSSVEYKKLFQWRSGSTVCLANSQGTLTAMPCSEGLRVF